MIPYPELVNALTAWRAKNGLPEWVDYLGDKPAPLQAAPAVEMADDVALIEDQPMVLESDIPLEEDIPLESDVPMDIPVAIDDSQILVTAELGELDGAAYQDQSEYEDVDQTVVGAAPAGFGTHDSLPDFPVE